MTKGQIILGILLFALATAVLYVWGLRKSMSQSADMGRLLLSRCGSRVVKYLKRHDTITKQETAKLIDGVTAGEFWSRKRLTVQEPKKFAGQVLAFLTEQQYLEPVDKDTYRLKK